MRVVREGKKAAGGDGKAISCALSDNKRYQRAGVEPSLMTEGVCVEEAGSRLRRPDGQRDMS